MIYLLAIRRNAMLYVDFQGRYVQDMFGPAFSQSTILSDSEYERALKYFDYERVGREFKSANIALTWALAMYKKRDEDLKIALEKENAVG